MDKCSHDLKGLKNGQLHYTISRCLIMENFLLHMHSWVHTWTITKGETQWIQPGPAQRMAVKYNAQCPDAQDKIVRLNMWLQLSNYDWNFTHPQSMMTPHPFLLSLKMGRDNPMGIKLTGFLVHKLFLNMRLIDNWARHVILAAWPDGPAQANKFNTNVANESPKGWT